MKRIIEDASDNGLVKLLGEKVTFFSLNYIYTGKLTGVNERYIELSEPSIVYETGDFAEKNWKDAQELPDTIYLMLSSVEAFGIVK